MLPEATNDTEPPVAALRRLDPVEVGTILRERVAVIITGDMLVGGGVSVGFSPGDPTSLLVGYLELIRSLRRQEKSPAITLRRDDILTIARYLDVDGAEVLDRLTALMGATASQRNTLAMLFAAGAIVIGLAAVGMPASAHEVGLPASVVGTGQTGVAGNSGALTEVVADTAMGSVAEVVIAGPADAGTDAARRVGPSFVISGPVAAPTENPVQNRSGCNPDPSEAVMRLVIPGISYSCPVYAGGQSMIDAGFVTHVTDVDAHPTLATRPGDPGTLWLAGHRSTNGAAFADVPDLPDGALITVGSGDRTATYRVVGRAYVEVRDGRVVDGTGKATADATRDSIIRADLGGDLAPRLVLQTCEGENFRWMIYADLV